MNWIDKPIIRTKRRSKPRRKLTRNRADGRFCKPVETVQVVRAPAPMMIPPAFVVDDQGNLSRAIGGP